jgi:hypothetical protein
MSLHRNVFHILADHLSPVAKTFNVPSPFGVLPSQVSLSYHQIHSLYRAGVTGSILALDFFTFLAQVRFSLPFIRSRSSFPLF